MKEEVLVEKPLLPESALLRKPAHSHCCFSTLELASSIHAKQPVFECLWVSVSGNCIQSANMQGCGLVVCLA